MLLLFRKIISKIKFLIIRVVLPLIIRGLYSVVPRKRNSLLIIKNDGIGDYILFRNYLEFLKNSRRYGHCKIYLLTNPACKNLVTTLDAEFIDGFFWYTDGYFLKWKLIKLLFNLQSLRLETIIYPNYSRKFPIDWLVDKVNARIKITVNGDTVNQSGDLKSKGNKYYTEIVNVSAGPAHEFERNRQIMEAITKETCEYEKPFVKQNIIKETPHRRIVIFPGGSELSKKWPAMGYHRLCKRICTDLKLNIVLAGGKNEIDEGKLIQGDIPDELITNQIDKLSLTELFQLIAGARFLISNDTVAVHMAACLGIPSVCIAKGDLFGRFIPYPENMAPEIHCIFPPGFIPLSRQQIGPFMDINSIKPDLVYASVCSLLKKSYIDETP